MPSCGVSVCVYVCLSRLCVKTNKGIFELFSPSGSHTILVIPYQTGWRYSDSDDDIPFLMGASIAGGVGRNRDSEPICLLLRLQQARCYKHGRDGRRPPSRKLWKLYRWSYAAANVFDHQVPHAIKSLCDKVTVSVVLQRKSDQALSHTIHNHDRSCVLQQGLTLCRRQQNRIELYALVNPKLK